MILKLYHRKSSGEMEKVGFLFSYLTVYHSVQYSIENVRSCCCFKIVTHFQKLKIFHFLKVIFLSLITFFMCVVVPPMAAEPERRIPWGGGSSGSTVGRDDFHIKYFVYIKKKENKRRKIC